MARLRLSENLVRVRQHVNISRASRHSSLPMLLPHQLTHLVHRLENSGVDVGRFGDPGQQADGVVKERIFVAGDARNGLDGIAALGRFRYEDFSAGFVDGKQDGFFHGDWVLLVEMAAATGMRGAVPAARALLGEAAALNGCTRTSDRRGVLAAIVSYPAVVDFTDAAVRFAAVAGPAQQLDIVHLAAAAA